MPPPTPLSVVMGDGGDILNLPNLHLWVSKRSECWLGTWSKGLDPVSSCGPEFDMLGSSLHLWAPVFWAAAFWAANMATFGEDSSRSAFLSPSTVIHQMGSLTERWVSWTKVSPKDTRLWQTPNVFSPSATGGPRLMTCSSIFFSLPVSFLMFPADSCTGRGLSFRLQEYSCYLKE